MTPENYNQWGSVPGKYNLNVTRNVTVFNYENPKELADTSKPPTFKLTKSAFLQELNIISEISTPITNRIQFNDNYVLNPIDDGQTAQNMQDLATIPNVYALGVWDIAKNYDRSTWSFNALGQLVLSLLADDVTYMSTLAQGVFTQAPFSEQKYSSFKSKICNPVKIPLDDVHCKAIFEDPNMGFNQNTTIKYWVQASYRGVNSQDAFMLADYFDLEPSQVADIIKEDSVLKGAINAIKETLMGQGGYTCKDVSKGVVGDKNVECTSAFLAYQQLADQSITKKPPAGPAFDSLTMAGNSTAMGYMEISYYRDSVFLNTTIKNEETTQEEMDGYKVSFTLDQTAMWFEHPDFGCTKSWSVLLHPMNMRNFIETGQKFNDYMDDNNGAKDFSIFDDLIQRFKLDSVYQARVLFEWLNYLGGTFATVTSMDTELTLRTTFFQQGAVQVWQGLLSLLKPTLLSEMMVIQENKIQGDCATAVSESSPSTSQDTIDKYCKNGFDVKNTLATAVFYLRPSKAVYEQTLQKYGFTFQQAKNLINTNDETVGSMAYIIETSETALASHYSCGADNHCSEAELISMQWFKSKVSTSLPDGFDPERFPAGDSVQPWFPKLIPSPFEYKALSPELTPPTPEQAIQLLFWDKFFAPTILTKAIGDAQKKGKDQSFEALKKDLFVSEKDFPNFVKYVNNFILEVAFGGQTVTATIEELIFGYKSPLLDQIQKTNPLMGGDPTADPVIALSPQYFNLTQQRNTGAEVLTEVDQYTMISGHSYINCPMKVYNGNDTYWTYINPWAEEVQVEGSDNLFPSGAQRTRTSLPTSTICTGLDGRHTWVQRRSSQEQTRSDLPFLLTIWLTNR